MRNISDRFIDRTWNNTQTVSIIAIFVMIISSFLMFSTDIRYFYMLLIGDLFLSIMIYNKINFLRSRLLMVVLYTLFIWIIWSYLVIYRNIGVVPFSPSFLLPVYTGALIGFLFVYCPINKLLFKLLLYGVLVYFFFNFVFLGLSYEALMISERTSDVSVIGLTLALIVPILYIEYKEERKIAVLPLLIQAFLSLFMLSRTGLGTCVILLVFALFFGVHSIRNYNSRVFLYIILVIIFFSITFFVLDNRSDFVGVAKTIERGSDLYGREILWKDYFDDFSFYELIFGKNIHGINTGLWQNAHNSWIQLHSQVGLVGVIIMILGIRVLIYHLKRDLFLALIMIALVFFSFFNSVFFFHYFDWSIYIFFFEFLRTRKRKILIKKHVKLTWI